MNAALTASSDGSMTTTQHTNFWLPIIKEVTPVSPDGVARSDIPLSQVVRAIFAAKAASGSDKDRGCVFAWWGSKGKKLRKLVESLEPEFPTVAVRHVEYCNPAAMGDMFCNSNHFGDLNSALSELGLDEIDWLPDNSWESERAQRKGGDDGTSARMGQFVSETLDLHKMYLERLGGVRDEKLAALPTIEGMYLMCSISKPI